MTAAARKELSPVAVVVFAGLVAGAFDIVYAIVSWGLRGVAPLRILQSVASGLLGPDAYQGGVETAGLGLALHFSIAIAAAGVFYAAALRLSILRRRPAVSGLAYGAAVFFVMNYVVLPLSAVGHFPNMTPLNYANALFANVAFFGLPLALVVSRFSRAKPS
jgi:uncharacterized membrane protein YagU involved in acid resistance